MLSTYLLGGSLHCHLNFQEQARPGRCQNTQCRTLLYMGHILDFCNSHHSTGRTRTSISCCFAELMSSLTKVIWVSVNLQHNVQLNRQVVHFLHRLQNSCLLDGHTIWIFTTIKASNLTITFLLYFFFWVIPRHQSFMCWGITQKKEHNIQNTVQVCNKELHFLFI